MVDPFSTGVGLLTVACVQSLRHERREQRIAALLRCLLQDELKNPVTNGSFGTLNSSGIRSPRSCSYARHDEVGSRRHEGCETTSCVPVSRRCLTVDRKPGSTSRATFNSTKVLVCHLDQNEFPRKSYRAACLRGLHLRLGTRSAQDVNRLHSGPAGRGRRRRPLPHIVRGLDHLQGGAVRQHNILKGHWVY